MFMASIIRSRVFLSSAGRKGFVEEGKRRAEE